MASIPRRNHLHPPAKSRHKDATAWMAPHLVSLMIAHSRPPVNPSSGHNPLAEPMDRIHSGRIPPDEHMDCIHSGHTPRRDHGPLPPRKLGTFPTRGRQRSPASPQNRQSPTNKKAFPAHGEGGSLRLTEEVHGRVAHHASTLAGISHPCYTTIEGIPP